MQNYLALVQISGLFNHLNQILLKTRKSTAIESTAMHYFCNIVYKSKKTSSTQHTCVFIINLNQYKEKYKCNVKE